jgi:hypothetical protein
MIPSRTSSGAFLRADKERKELYAELGGVGSLSVCLQLDEDAPGQVFPYFMRGGIIDNAMSAQELDRALFVLRELFVIAQENWPKHFKRGAE